MVMQELFLQGDGLEYLPAFAISLAVGLLVGVERERSPAAKAGLRTFGLVAMLGTLLALISERTTSAWVLPAGFIAVAAIIVSAYMDGDEAKIPAPPLRPRCCYASAWAR